MDPYILEEASLLSREYSLLRKTGIKWLFKSEKLSDKNDESQKIETYNPFITVNRGDLAESYKTSHLLKRSHLRRNLALVKIFQHIWEIINPIKIAGISEKVYFSFFELAYSRTKREGFESIERFIQIDRRVDFKGKTWLGFSDLYDSVFEFLDTYTKGKASIEYILLLKSIHLTLQDYKWCGHLNLYSKLHVPSDAKNVYSNWMFSVLRTSEKKFHKEEVPDLIRIPMDFHVSERLLKKRVVKPVDRENFNVKKLEQMMKMQFIKEFKQYPRSSTQNTARNKFLDKKICTFYNGHLDKISPLSCVLKQSKSKPSIIEKVIDGRKTMNFKVMSQKELLRD